MEAVIRQAQRLKNACSNPHAEWSEQSLAITDLADAIQLLDVNDHCIAVLEHLLPLAPGLGDLLRNIRSKLVADVCEQLGRIVKTTRLAFTPLANALLDALAGTAKASSVAIRNPGFQLFSDVSEYARYDLQAIHRVFRSSPQERVKSLLLEQMQIVLTYWSKDDIAPYYSDMLEVMRRGLLDPSLHVRTACRQTFCSFADIWQERLHELVDIPTPPTRSLLVKEKPHAAITKAIQQKFHIGTPKGTRADSIRQRSTVVRRQGFSTAGDSDDSGFVEIKESPRRPLQRTTAAEPSKRGPSPGRAPSPGRGTTRSASPSGATPSARAASPSSATRGVSPIRPLTRGASPSRAGNGALLGRPPPARTVTQAPVRTGEYDRDENSTLLEEKVEATSINNENLRPRQVAPPRPQKRVSIVEPSIRTTTSNQVERQLQELKYLREDMSPRDFSQPPPSDVSSGAISISPPKTRFAAAAREFVSRTQAGPIDHGSHAQLPDSMGSERYGDQPSASAGYFNRGQEDARRTETDYSEAPYDSRLVESFLDREDVSSSPAPMPRAPENVTIRRRRRSVNAHVTAPIREELPEAHQPQNGVPQVPAPPVADQISAVRSLEAEYDPFSSEGPPPSASIDSTLYRGNIMATTQNDFHAHDELTPQVEATLDEFADPEGDKENIRDENTRENIGQPSGSFKADVPKLDAVANLDAIRAGLKSLLQTPLSGGIGGPSTTSPSFERKDPPPAQNNREHPPTAPLQPRTNTREAARFEMKAAPVEQVAHNVGSNNSLKPSTAPTPPPSIAPSSQDRQNVRAPPSLPKPSWSEETPAPKPVETPVFEAKPSRDFVHQPTAFTFATAAPPVQRTHQTLPRQGPPSHVDVDRHQDQQQSTNQREARKVENAPVAMRPDPFLSRGNTSAPVRMASANQAAQYVGHRAAQDKKANSGAAHDTTREQPFVLNNESSSQPVTPPPSQEQPRPSPPSTQSNGDQHQQRRPTVLNPKPATIEGGVASKMLFSFCFALGIIFGISGLIQAVTKVRDAYEYHNALLTRINQFEVSIVESYESVRKMDEKYAVWSEYVRELTEQDESNALHQLEAIQLEVEQWQTDMKNDLLEFKRSLSGDIIDAALAQLRDSNATSEDTSSAPETTT